MKEQLKGKKKILDWFNNILDWYIIGSIMIIFFILVIMIINILSIPQVIERLITLVTAWILFLAIVGPIGFITKNILILVKNISRKREKKCH